MADIKTRDVVKGTIKTLNKSIFAIFLVLDKKLNLSVSCVSLKNTISKTYH